MSISVQTMLQKIEKELHEAKGQGDQARVRERVHAIKTLCELILDQPQNSSVASTYRKQAIEPPSIQLQPSMQAPNMGQTKPMKMDDTANGDSLFDF
ncbi:YwdI family protein [Cytobacillus purgationiresistens]|uniref:YwdI family protein n=1 Tax=Cytobacillus purgationiresistens TaxID=863449 RepID=A0ABU0AKJ4_9BACI|nr:YwdI family protein [Cytobacillus purgationiresistens]MDQ0271778.1 hypothetical protein [Cytobacillus purgationiresistens]